MSTTKDLASTGEQTSLNDGVVYEPAKSETTPKTYTKALDTINKLRSEVEQKTAQFRSLIEKIILKQGSTLANTDEMWRFLADGDFTVDAQTKAQAHS